MCIRLWYKMYFLLWFEIKTLKSCSKAKVKWPCFQKKKKSKFMKIRPNNKRQRGDYMGNWGHTDYLTYINIELMDLISFNKYIVCTYTCSWLNTVRNKKIPLRSLCLKSVRASSKKSYMYLAIALQSGKDPLLLCNVWPPISKLHNSGS